MMANSGLAVRLHQSNCEPCRLPAGSSSRCSSSHEIRCHTRNHAAKDNLPEDQRTWGHRKSSFFQQVFLPTTRPNKLVVSTHLSHFKKLAKSNQIICPMIREQINKLLKQQKQPKEKKTTRFFFKEHLVV